MRNTSNLFRHITIAAIVLSIFSVSASAARIVSVSDEIYESEQVISDLDTEQIERIVFSTSGSLSGTVAIHTAESDHKLSYVQHFKAISLEQAEEFAEYLDVSTSRGNGTIRVEVSARRNSPWEGTNFSARLELHISVPESIAVEIESRSFDANIAGPFSTVHVNNEFGKIKVRDVYEGLIINTTNSRITLQDISGGVDVSTSNNPIKAQNIDTRGEVARFTNEYGLIEVSRFSGRLYCETSYSPIDLRGIRLKPGDSRLTTTYSTIEAEIIEIDSVVLDVSDNFSNVYLTLPETAEAEFDLNADKGGRIYLHGISVTPIEMEQQHLLARTDNPDSHIRVDISGIGTIEIRGKKFYGAP
jgi:DUF4097 and DUF4098 domain-containing protein YvlB